MTSPTEPAAADDAPKTLTEKPAADTAVPFDAVLEKLAGKVAEHAKDSAMSEALVDALMARLSAANDTIARLRSQLALATTETDGGTQ